METIMETDVRVRATPRVEVRDSDLIPDETQNLLIYWRDKIKDGYFQIGDISNQMILRSAMDGYSVKQEQVYSAVGRFCGKSGRTVRYYAETAAFYSENVRNEYEMLPFSHFVYARTLGEKWKEVLDKYKKTFAEMLDEDYKIEYLEFEIEEPRTASSTGGPGAGLGIKFKGEKQGTMLIGKEGDEWKLDEK